MKLRTPISTIVYGSSNAPHRFGGLQIWHALNGHGSNLVILLLNHKLTPEYSWVCAGVYFFLVRMILQQTISDAYDELFDAFPVKFKRLQNLVGREHYKETVSYAYTFVL